MLWVSEVFIGSSKGLGEMTRYWWNSFYLGSIPIETQKKIPDTQIVLLVTLESLEKKAKRQIFGRHFGRHLVTTKVATRKKFFFLKPWSQIERVTETFSFGDPTYLYSILFPFLEKK